MDSNDYIELYYMIGVLLVICAIAFYIRRG